MALHKHTPKQKAKILKRRKVIWNLKAKKQKNKK